MTQTSNNVSLQNERPFFFFFAFSIKLKTPEIGFILLLTQRVAKLQTNNQWVFLDRFLRTK